MQDAFVWFQAALTRPTIAQFLLVFLVAEFLVLSAWRAQRGGGVPAFQLLCFLGAGAGFAIALWGAFAAWSWPWMATALAVAFLFHLCDLVQRWER